MLEAYRNFYDGTPVSYEYELVLNTAAHSSNWGANILLDRVANQDNAYLGSDILTESMHHLGLQNTFIVTPYEEVPRPDKRTLITEANSREDRLEFLDEAMQTTAEDMGILLAMIYDCSQGGGTLLLVYPEQLTPHECQELIDTMALNTEINWIRFGVPFGTKVAHKHGFAAGTHGDAGIIYTPYGPYVLVEYLYQPTDWLVYDYSSPFMQGISRLTYNYFNPDQPYLGDPYSEPERFPEPEVAEETTPEEGATEGDGTEEIPDPAELGDSVDTN
jgi:hypothetical protein